MDRATIFALSSGAPPAAISVIRVSGPNARQALLALHGRLPPPRRAMLGWLSDPATGERLDRALLLWFPGPGTATGEDLAELHVHGGRAVGAAVLGGLARVPGLRLAEPGEFTRRAFENGVIDLAEAEGLADLIAAETETQRRNALHLVGGILSRRVEGWQARIVDLAAQVEATLDFGDEADVPGDPTEAVRADAGAVAAEIDLDLRAVSAERLRDGVRVVLAGPPNAGKSTLLNAIAGRPAAIIAASPGTTRDVIEVPVALAGIPFLLSDTAGLREQGADEIESIGMERARQQIAGSDILLWLGEPGEAPAHACRLLLHARCDAADRRAERDGTDLAISGMTGVGVDALVAQLIERGRKMLPGGRDVALNERQRRVLRDCGADLEQAAGARDPILLAEHLRAARGALDRLTGRAGAEEMLDALFGRFCIGK